MNKPTLSGTDIARMVGVSRSTVSKVLNGYPNVSEKTREQVIKAVEQSGYYPNHAAQTLKGRQQRVLGFFSIDTGQIQPAYIMGMMALGVYNVASRMGYQVLTMQVRPDGSNLSEVMEVFQQGRVDAGIFQPHDLFVSITKELVAQGRIVGIFDDTQENADQNGFLSVSLDNYGCAFQAMDYLFAKGHRRISIIAGSPDWLSVRERLRGFTDALAGKGLSPVGSIRPCDGLYEDAGREKMKDILDAGERPTGVVCTNDNLAVGAIEAIRSRNLSVPGDISVIGMENNPVGVYILPQLTTFKWDMELWIKSLLEMVVAKIERPEEPGECYKQILFDLVERKSCRDLNVT